MNTKFKLNPETFNTQAITAHLGERCKSQCINRNTPRFRVNSPKFAGTARKAKCPLLTVITQPPEMDL